MKRPNILLIYTDQQRWDALGANGNPDIQTPNLDKLAGSALNFDHCFVQNPVCMPSRVSMLSGRYCNQLGIFINGVPVPEELNTLPTLLAGCGYRRANIGKLHFLPHADRDHRDPHPAYGFDHMEISDEPGCYADAYRAWVARKAPDQLDGISCGLPPAAELWRQAMRPGDDGIKHPEERFPKRPIPFAADEDLTHSAFVAEQTMEYLRARAGGDEPFLCIAGFYSPHSPWIVPQSFLDRYDPSAFTLPTFPEEVDAQRGPGKCDDDELRAARHGYYAMVTEVDHHVGRILNTLDELNLADDTIVVFTSDHGEFLGDQLMYGKGYPAPDCVSRVPLLVRIPGGPTGTRTQIVEHVDLVPTLLELAGLQAPAELQGEPLPLTGDAPGKRSALTEGIGWKALRTEQYRYIAEADGSEKLIDLSADPGEYHNRAGRPDYDEPLSDCRAEMLRKLLEIERPEKRRWTY